MIKDLFGGGGGVLDHSNPDLMAFRKELEQLSEKFPKIHFCVGMASRQEDGTAVAGFLNGRPECVYYAFVHLQKRIERLLEL